MFLLGKGKEKVIERKSLDACSIYLRNVNEYVEYYGDILGIKNPINDKEFYESMATPYYSSAMKITNYLIEKYPDNLFAQDNTLELDYDDLVDNMDENAKKYFLVPTLPSLIYINDKKYSTHFHTDGDVITEAEGIEFLPGLSYALANSKINGLFKGLSVIEARNLLQQMSILPKNSELEKVIKNYNMNVYFNKKYLESLICLLLVVNKNSYSVNRARFIADSLGIDFDFSYYEAKDMNEKKLAL